MDLTAKDQEAARTDGQPIKQQPPGLYLLFATEMWERFSFYIMRALLVLYMTHATVEGGLGFSESCSLKIYSYYLGIAYITPVLGGLVADWFIGPYKSALIGGFLMAVGHALMAVQETHYFFAALLLVALGNGFFKPNLTAILGRLYEERDNRRDGGYAIFYMGINIGGVLSGISAGVLRRMYGYEAGFAAAAFAMVLSLVIFTALSKDLLPRSVREKGPVKTGARAELSKSAWERIWVLIVLNLALTVFIIAFEQIGGLLNLFAQNFVDRRFDLPGVQYLGWVIPTEFFQSLNPLFIVLFSPIISILWVRLGERNPFYSTKVVGGLLLTSISWLIMVLIVPEQITSNSAIHWSWLVLQYALTTLGELCIIPVVWSCVSALAPRGYASTLMAGSMIAVGVGSWLSGQVGAAGIEGIHAIEFTGAEGECINMGGCKSVFAFLCVLPAATALVLSMMHSKLKEWAGGR